MTRLLDTFHSHLTIVHKEDGARDTPEEWEEVMTEVSETYCEEVRSDKFL